MAYSPGDKIFAKVKGHPHWPSRINLLPPDVSIPKGKYPIFFYGTHEVYFLAPKDIYPYEKFKHKYAIPRNKALFQAGLREIEEDPDVLLYGKDPQSEEFLARFYKFSGSAALSQSQEQHQKTTEAAAPPSTPAAAPVTPSATAQATTQSGKRTNTSSPAECPKPAKRPHVEATPRSTPKNRKKSSPKAKPSPAQQTTRSRRTPVISKPAPALPVEPILVDQPLSVQTDSQSDGSATRPKRLASLRLRIRNDGDGLKFSPALESPQSPVSPSTTGSAGTIEARRPDRDTPTPTVENTPDPLRITIKQLSTSPSIVSTTVTSNSSSVPARPVFAVAPSPSHGLMGVGLDSGANLARKKSTAVVTPLRRERAPPLPELSDDSVDVSTPSTDGETPSSRASPPSDARTPTVPKRDSHHPRRSIRMKKLKHSHGERKERRHKADTSKLSDSVTATTTPLSEQDSSSTQSPWPSSDYGKNSELASSRLGSSAVSSPKAHSSHKLTKTATTDDIDSRGSHVEVSDTVGKENKEQQLKDLGTEARLLLIDRSIKSSLVRDHEDIVTCVDRLAVLDRMTISLPVLAKCWTVVETIRKCRRYKRSLEVKIAAQKVFNKFLQLYATADKIELDLAQAELVRHQQRYARQHSARSGQSGPGTLDTVVPPYTGPKSIAELFQVSLTERRLPTSEQKLTSHSGSDSVTNSVTKSAGHEDLNESKTETVSSKLVDTNQSKSVAEELLPGGFSISDIPLPEESTSEPRTRLSNSCSEHVEVPSAGENGEEEFEVLDEYEETGDVKSVVSFATVTSQSCPTVVTAVTPSGTDYVPLPVVAYNMMQPQFIPAASFSTAPGVASDAVPASPSTTVAGFVTSAGAVPPYPTPYAIPYGYGCLPGSSFTQVMQAPPPPAPYGTPLGNAVSCSASGSSSYSMPVEATPPQAASRAYVPHALHPPTDPPPPYRPYIPTRCETDQSMFDPSAALSPRTSREARSDGASSRHSGSSSRHAPIQSPSSPVRRSTTNSSAPRPEQGKHSHSHSARSGTDRRFRTPPHRARSPHALPHPLEHYQRCLATALSSDEDRPGGSSEPVWVDDPVLKPVSQVARVNTDDLFMRPDSEDLDARIARLIGTAPRPQQAPKASGVVSSSERRRPTNPLGSPPPPPPPPPHTSQRILFTHRPHPNPPISNRPVYSSSARHPSRSAHGSNDPLGYASSATRRSLPPHTPDSPPVRRNFDVDHRISGHESAHPSRTGAAAHMSNSIPKPSVSRPIEDSLPVHHPIRGLPPASTYPDHPADSVRLSGNQTGLSTNTAPVHHDSSSSASRAARPNCDEDREIYSMLGV